MQQSKKSISRKRQNLSPIPSDGSIFRPRQSNKTNQRVVRGGSFDGISSSSHQTRAMNGNHGNGTTRTRSRYLTRQSVSIAKRGDSGKTVWLARTRSSEEVLNVGCYGNDDSDEYDSESAKLALHASFDAGILNYNDSSQIIEEEMPYDGIDRGPRASARNDNGNLSVNFKFGEPFEEWHRKRKSCKKTGDNENEIQMLDTRGNTTSTCLRNDLEETSVLSKEKDCSAQQFYPTKAADSDVQVALRSKMPASTPNGKAGVTLAAVPLTRTPFVSRTTMKETALTSKTNETPSDFVTPHARSRTDAVAPFSLSRKGDCSTSSFPIISAASHSCFRNSIGTGMTTSISRKGSLTSTAKHSNINNNSTKNSSNIKRRTTIAIESSSECYGDNILANGKTKMLPTNPLETPHRQSQSSGVTHTGPDGTRLSQSNNSVTSSLKEGDRRELSSMMPPPSNSTGTRTGTGSTQSPFCTPAYPSFHSGLPPLTPTRPMLHSLQSSAGNSGSFTPHPQKLQMNSGAPSHRSTSTTTALDGKTPARNSTFTNGTTGTTSTLYYPGGLPENAPDSNNSSDSQFSSSSTTPFRFSTFPASLPRVQPKTNLVGTNLEEQNGIGGISSVGCYNPPQTPTQLQFQPQTPKVDVDSSREEMNSQNTSLSSLSVEGGPSRNIAIAMIGGESSVPSPLSPFLFKDNTMTMNGNSNGTSHNQYLFSPKLRMRIPIPESHDTTRAVWLSPVVRGSNDGHGEHDLQDSSDGGNKDTVDTSDLCVIGAKHPSTAPEGAVRTRLNFSSSFSPEGFRALLDGTDEGTLRFIS